MYSLPGYIEKKKKRIKNCHQGKKLSNNDKSSIAKKKSTYFEFEVNCKSKVYYQKKKIKRSGIKAQETIEILPINIVIQT